MTPSELRDLIARLGLTQPEVARLLGTTDRSVRMWLTGARNITPLAARVLRLLEAGKLTREDLVD